MGLINKMNNIWLLKYIATICVVMDDKLTWCCEVVVKIVIVSDNITVGLLMIIFEFGMNKRV